MQKRITAIYLLITLFSCNRNEEVYTNSTNEPSESQGNTGDGTETPVRKVAVYSFDSEANSSLMFQDEEVMATTTTAEIRGFNIGNVLRVRAINEKTIEVANLAPIDLKNAVIMANIHGQPKPIQLFNIDHSSSMTYPKDGMGIRILADRTAKTAFENGLFPIRLDNYYTPNDYK